ncbi:MAG: cupin domain-containing protein [Dehalococcoidales bacterium]|nr:cupin domain-containing protein [Dehalococcoidales bacterium]
MVSDPAQLIGQRLREARLARGWSARDLAAAGDIALNTVSLIERGKISPTVATLHKLANALGVPLSFFVEEPAGRPIAFLRREERRRTRGLHMWLENLGAGLPEQTMEPLLVTLEPNADSGPEPIVHAGQELVFCLEGQIEYQVEDETFLLGPEDSLFFEARLPHRWRNPTDAQARMLLIIETAEQPG